MVWGVLAIAVAVAYVLCGIRIVRPIERGLIERLGRYNRFASPGFHWILPIFERLIWINITETMIDAGKQGIITKDRLNSSVDAQIYFKVKIDEQNVKNSQYNVNNYEYQIINLCRTTLRNIIGTLMYDEVNSNRDKINFALQSLLKKEAAPWGIEIVRTELKEIDAPADVQESMNQVIMAENKKKAAIDMATATETQADGMKRANIKSAEGLKQAAILEAEGRATATIKVAEADAKRIQLVNEAAKKYFKGEAQVLKKLEVTQEALRDNAKIIVDAKGVQTIVTDAAGVKPIPVKQR
jgi:regulator of protease activity HflC (stomatin/prohibitin superfamily)